MKSRSSHRVTYTAAALALTQMPLTATAQFTYLNQFAPGTLTFLPIAVGSGPNGQVVVVDSIDGIANYYSPDGTLQGGLLKTDNLGGLSFPTFATVGSDGNFYVADHGRTSIEVYNSNGVEQSVIQQSAFSQIVGIAASSAGNLYTNSNSTVYNYTTSGQFKSSFSQSPSTSQVGQMALDASASYLYIADTTNNSIDVVSIGGTPEGTFGSTAGPGQMNHPNGVAVSGSGLVYVADANDGIKVYSLAGTYLQTAVTAVNGQSFEAYGLAVNPLGMVYASTGAAVDRFFDPASWVSGTNSFTNAITGPTSVAVGSGQLMGTSLTISSSMGLNVGTTTAVEDGGILTLNGGALTTNTLVIDGTTSGASFTMVSGSLNAASVNVSNGGVADFTGSPLSAILSGTVTVTGASSQFKVDQGAIVTAPALTSSGQVIVGTGADLIIYSGVTNSGSVNLTGGELDVRGILTNPLGQTIQGAGTLSTTLGLVNAGTLALSGSSNVLGSINNSGGTIHLSGNTPNIFYGTTLNTGTLTVDAGASGTFYGAYNGSSASAIIDNGSLYLNANSVSGTISGRGNLTIGSNSSSPAILTILPGSNASSLATLSVAPNSSVNLTTTALVVEGGGLAALNALATQGYNGGKWNGSGISSSAAAADTKHLTAIGIIQNNQSGTALYNSSHQFLNTTPGAGDILAAYTYYGDANLSGKVDSADYALIDNGYLSHLTGWFDGDFNYDGVVNGSDYTLIDNAFNTQGAQLSVEIAAATAQLAGSGETSVPEPAGLGLVVIGTLGSLGRRTRRGDGSRPTKLWLSATPSIPPYA